MRLSSKALADLNKALTQPSYLRQDLIPQVLHFGLGRFHQAHQCWYYQKLNEQMATNIGVVGVSFFDENKVESFHQQEGLYVLQSCDENEIRYHLMNVLIRALHLKRDWQEILSLANQPSIKILSLTITEKAYFLTENGLNLGAKQVQSDLENFVVPETIYGVLQKILETCDTPLTLLSCDNILQNGQKLKNAFLRFLEAKDSSLLKRAEEIFDFPSSMVDRIVPATVEQDIENFRNKFQLEDQHFVKTEDFSQWVIEKPRFEFPPLEKVGVQIVQDVSPYEQAKLFLLNASHSWMAYVGLHAGKNFVHEVLEDEGLNRSLGEVFSEICSVIEFKIPVEAYIAKLKERFKNINLPHRLNQIACDGSAKIPQRWEPIFLNAREKNIPLPQLSKGLQAWQELLKQESTEPGRYDFSDPLLKKSLS